MTKLSQLTSALSALDLNTEAALVSIASDQSKSSTLIRFLSHVAIRLGVSDHVYVVGGAVRNFVLGVPPKDVDIVIDVIGLGGKKDSAWFSDKLARAISAPTKIVTNQYGVTILTIAGDFILDGFNFIGEQLEIANARTESYGKGEVGKGYKPDSVELATIDKDVYRREFAFNTLLWRMSDLAEGPEKAEIIDITGLGLKHLKEKLIKTPLDPDETFANDPTRILRVEKFLWRYGMTVDPATEIAMSRQAKKMKEMPWEAIAKILVDDILSKPTGIEALRHMESLGIMGIISEMVSENPPMRTYLINQLKSIQNMGLVFEFDRLGLGALTPVSFLTPAQRSRFEEIAVDMDHEGSVALLGKLKVPPIDNMAIIKEFGLKGAGASIIAPIAKEVILDNPDILKDNEVLQSTVRERIKAKLLK